MIALVCKYPDESKPVSQNKHPKQKKNTQNKFSTLYYLQPRYKALGCCRWTGDILPFALQLGCSYFSFNQLQSPSFTWKWFLRSLLAVTRLTWRSDKNLLSLCSIWENVHLYKTNNAEHMDFIYLEWNSPSSAFVFIMPLSSALLPPGSALQERSFTQKW